MRALHARFFFLHIFLQKKNVNLKILLLDLHISNYQKIYISQLFFLFLYEEKI